MSKLIKENKFILSIITLILLLGFGFFYFPGHKVFVENSVSLKPKDKSIIKLGKNVYVKNCASCHGVNLEGEENWKSRKPNGMMPAPPHDETGHTWHHNDNYLFMITKYGVEQILGEKYPNNMPAYKEILSDKEIIAVLSYIKSTWSPKVQKIHDQINTRSK